MGLKPDHWIRKMALEHGMIEPFVDSQVRQGVISYGLSSYGYDIRVSDEFKIFSPHNAVNQLTQREAAWLAGLMDGEGSITVSNRVRSRNGIGTQQPRLTIGMTSQETIDTIHQLTGVGNVYYRSPKMPQHHPVWVWNVTKTSHVHGVLIQLLPYMVTKRKAAVLAFQLVQRRKTESLIVDPKQLDPRSMVPYKGDVCLIPPNSFALAVTVEHFRIPRNVLAVTTGKSTYARVGVITNVTPLEPEWTGYVTLEISNTTPLPAKIYANEGIAQVLFFEADEPCEISYADKKGKYQDQVGIVLPKV